jgi:predicted transposase YdaD
LNLFKDRLKIFEFQGDIFLNKRIEKELEELFSDILYKVNLAGQEAYLYFLFEHKSCATCCSLKRIA